jgi:hypothetical protein
MQTRELQYDLRQLQGEAWSQLAMLDRIERELPAMTETERAAYAEHMAVFTRNVLNASLALLRSAVDLSEAHRDRQELVSRIEATLAGWSTLL